MTIVINGSGTITGLSAGGLNDGIITQAELATGVAGTGPAFRAYNANAQTFSASTYTKIQFNTEVFDTSNCYDTATYRFTPNVAGYYQVNVFLYENTTAQTLVYKNGSLDTSGMYGALVGFPCTGLVYLNGTTDYVEAYYWGNAKTTSNLGASSSQFSAVLVRAA